MHAFLTDLSEPLPLRLGRPLSAAGSRGQWEGPQVAEAGLSLPSEGVRRLGRGRLFPWTPDGEAVEKEQKLPSYHRETRKERSRKRNARDKATRES